MPQLIDVTGVVRFSFVNTPMSTSLSVAVLLICRVLHDATRREAADQQADDER
jgi:hypothetical protein